MVTLRDDGDGGHNQHHKTYNDSETVITTTLTMLWLRVLIALSLILGVLYPTWARKLSLWDRLEDPRQVFP